MKLIVLDGNAMNPGDLDWGPLAALGELVVHGRTPPELIAERIGDAEAAFTNEAPINAATLAACPGLRYIGVTATGYNVVDVAEAARRGVVVSNVPDYSTDAVAQFAFALLLEVCHRVADLSVAVHAGEWAANPDFTHWKKPLIELSGKTMGIVGHGRIGRRAAALAEAFGMRVLATPGRNGSAGAVGTNTRIAPLEEVLAEADVVSMHCPLTPATAGMINAKTIAAMRNGAIFINTARGGLVVEKDLAAALESGKLLAAGLDVVALEPVRPDNPLLSARNCFITPHVAWAAKETRARLLGVVVDNLKAFLAGKPANVVTA